MQNETVARRYAAAVLSLASEAGAIEQVGANLRTVSEAIFGDVEARRFFLSPVFDRKQKALVLARMFEGHLAEIALCCSWCVSAVRRCCRRSSRSTTRQPLRPEERSRSRS